MMTLWVYKVYLCHLISPVIVELGIMEYIGFIDLFWEESTPYNHPVISDSYVTELLNILFQFFM